MNALRDDTPGTEPASVRKNDRAIFGDVFVEQDARLSIAQQSRQRGLAMNGSTFGPRWR